MAYSDVIFSVEQSVVQSGLVANKYKYTQITQIYTRLDTTLGTNTVYSTNRRNALQLDERL